MISIKINNDRVKIPTYRELTVKQYRDLIPFIASHGGIDYLRYISITTGIDYQASLHCEVRGLDRLNTMLGKFLFISGDVDTSNDSFVEGVKSPKLIIKFEGKYFDFRHAKLKEVGYRILLQEYMKGQPTYLDLYLYMVACMIADNFDYDEVMTIKDKLEACPALDVLTIGAFFFRRWKRREFPVTMTLRMLQRVMSISSRMKGKRLVLFDSRNTRPLTKS